MSKKYEGPKILLLDVETAPILGYVWGLWENNVGLNQIKADWHLLSFACKWYTDAKGKTYGPHKKVIYYDQRKAKSLENDKVLLDKVWKLLNECDILITQNGVSFDVKKLNARFIMHGMQPPAPYKNIDTLKIAKNKFKFTSNKLEYLTNNLCTTHKKLKTKKYVGFDLWKACLDKNVEAFDEMQAYNIMDILSLEELYHKFQPWDNSINFNLYNDDNSEITCNCGSTSLHRRGYAYTTAGRFQRFQCTECGSWSRGNKNMIEKDRRDLFKKKIT